MKCEIAIETKHAEKILQSLEPELKNDNNERTKTKVEAKKGKIEIKIDAKDLTALKAAVNSNLRLIETSMKVFEKECD